MLRLFFILTLITSLSGCLHSNKIAPIDNTYSARSQSSRIDTIVIHYTASELTPSLEILTKGEVSAHYLIPPDGKKIYQLVDEQRRAWHAGDSQWNGRRWLNATSIGIELVHPGYIETTQGRQWPAYSDAQISALIELLKDLQTRHAITPRNIVGHSDIAPQRKVDPGPAFPWPRLADAGLIRWPSTTGLQSAYTQLNNNVPPALWFQQQLARLGYAIAQTGQWDENSRVVLAAFQMKYRPERFDGQPDITSAALLLALKEP